MPKLRATFYQQENVCNVAQALLGKHLFTRMDRTHLTGGIIVETEAYAGPEDRASHAFANRRTPRTEVMFGRAGRAYVYLCYGMHALFNVVTNRAGTPHAVLIRAIEPTTGIETMLARRNRKNLDPSLTAGPACLTQALAIDTAHNGESLLGNRIWIGDAPSLTPERIRASPRVGVDYAGAHANRPWRFRVKDSIWTSKAT